MIVWLTGRSGAGKTTLANGLINDKDNWLNLDGDIMRNVVSVEAEFSRKDRWKHNLRIARLANFLDSSLPDYDIIISIIAPMRKVRKEITKICKPLWVYLKRTLPKRKGHFYEELINYKQIDIDVLTVEESYNKLLKIIYGR